MKHTHVFTAQQIQGLIRGDVLGFFQAPYSTNMIIYGRLVTYYLYSPSVLMRVENVETIVDAKDLGGAEELTLKFDNKDRWCLDLLELDMLIEKVSETDDIIFEHKLTDNKNNPLVGATLTFVNMNLVTLLKQTLRPILDNKNNLYPNGQSKAEPVQSIYDYGMACLLYYQQRLDSFKKYWHLMNAATIKEIKKEQITIDGGMLEGEKIDGLSNLLKDMASLISLYKTSNQPNEIKNLEKKVNNGTDVPLIRYAVL